MGVQRSTVIFAWLLLFPALLYVTVIVAYPLVDTVILSFTDASLKKVTNWVGFENYAKIFNDTFAGVIIRTFIWTFFSVSIKMIIGTLGAALLNSAVPGRALFRVLTMPPWVVPMAIGIFMWGWMYNGQFGMISGLLQRFGIFTCAPPCRRSRTISMRPPGPTAPAVSIASAASPCRFWCPSWSPCRCSP